MCSWYKALSPFEEPTFVLKIKRFKYDARVLLQTIHLATGLKGGAKTVHAIIGKSLATALPSCFQAEFLHSVSKAGDEFIANELSEGLRLPSETVTRRYEFSVDLAIAKVTRKRAARMSAVLKFMLADSSPVGNCDWLWSLYYEIERCRMVQVNTACNNLAVSIKAYVAMIQEQATVNADVEVADDANPDSGEPRARFTQAQLEYIAPEWKPWLETLKRHVIHFD